MHNIQVVKSPLIIKIFSNKMAYNESQAINKINYHSQPFISVKQDESVS